VEPVPFELIAIDAYRNRDAWDASAAEIVATMLARWQLIPGAAFVGGESGSVLRVTQEDGSPAVLKVGFPHFEGEWEAAGLDALGAVAPAVLRQDPWTWSLLLEAIEPGDPLSTVPLPAAEALDVAADLLKTINSTPPPRELLMLETVADAYGRNARARLPEQQSALESLGVAELVGRAIDNCESLARSGSQGRFLHGDFNPGNVLLGMGGSWFVVDPKPMRGDPAFDAAPMISQLGDPWHSAHPERALADQVMRFCDRAGLDIPRVTEWGFARCGLDVSWHLEDGNRHSAKRSAAQLLVWSRLT
jgi:streptomycin 6-kinase